MCVAGDRPIETHIDGIVWCFLLYLVPFDRHSENIDRNEAEFSVRTCVSAVGVCVCACVYCERAVLHV